MLLLAESVDLVKNLNENNVHNSIHFYDSIDRNSVKENGNKTNGFPKGPRFQERNKMLKEKSFMPSCQSYNHSFYGTIEERSRKIIPQSRNGIWFSNSVNKFDIKNHTKGLDKQQSPGPASYSTENRSTLSNFKTNFNGSFTREKRNITKSFTIRSPGPSDYDTKSVYKNLNSIKGAATIGKCKRQFDLKLMNPIYVKDIHTKLERRKY